MISFLPCPNKPPQESFSSSSFPPPMFQFFSYFRYSSYLSCYFFLVCFLCLSRHAFPARIIPDSVTVATTTSNQTHNATWHDFTRFLDACNGSEVTGMSELKKYFHKFGYLAVPDTDYNFTDVFDSQLEIAVLTYQSNLGLPVTGKLDSDTITSITSPRCGVSDTHLRNSNRTTSFVHTTKHYQYFYGKPRWVRDPPVKLTYSFMTNHMISYIDTNEIKTVFKRAFTRWAAVIPVSFEEVEDSKSADIRIGFYKGDHGDGEPFDGVLGVLGHAFSPENGRLHLDEAETWAVDFGNEKSRVAVDLESVATHEIGHVLGLAHTSVKEAVMYPSLSPRNKKVDLKIDDVEGVQALYGSNPNFRFSSLLESENSSNNNEAVGLQSGRMSIWTFVVVAVLVVFLCH